MANEVATTSNPIGQLIAQNQKAIRSVLPKHMDPTRMARLAMVEARRNPQLMSCTPQSFIGALIVASQLGLEPGVAGMGNIIPFKSGGRMEAQFVPGYRGLMTLARRSGQVGAINAEVVRAEDIFEYQLGTDPYIRHVPAKGERGPVTHVYAAAHLIGTEDWQFKILTTSDVEEVRKRAPGSKRKTSPWNDPTHWDEMAKKTAIRSLCKMLPMSVETQKAVTLDEMAAAGISQQTDAELPEGWADIGEVTQADDGDGAEEPAENTAGK